jgi:hypothetical protein
MQELYKAHKRRLRTFMTQSPTAFNLCIQRFSAMVDEEIKYVLLPAAHAFTEQRQIGINAKQIQIQRGRVVVQRLILD